MRILPVFRWIRRLFRAIHRWWIGPVDHTGKGEWDKHTIGAAGRSSLQAGAAFGAAYETVNVLSQSLPQFDFRTPWGLLLGLMIVKFVLEFLRKVLKNYKDESDAARK